MEGCIVEMRDLSGKDHDQTCKDQNNSSQDKNSSVENQVGDLIIKCRVMAWGQRRSSEAEDILVSQKLHKT